MKEIVADRAVSLTCALCLGNLIFKCLFLCHLYIPFLNVNPETSL
jgi:hypothetical protein